MRDDLLDAKAAVDWAVSQIPILQERIIAWKRESLYSVRIDTDSELGKKLYRLCNVKPLDPIINAEAGIIVHSIRSSLDLLACTLAARNGVVGSKSTYFPIWKSAGDWADPASEVLKKIKRLSQIDQTNLKNLRPYPGGDDMLVALHDLDLTRKHRRLLGTFIRPRGIGLFGFGETAVDYEEWKSGFNEETVLVSTDASAADGKVTISVEITFNEAVPMYRADLARTLREFADLANSIIDRFG